MPGVLPDRCEPVRWMNAHRFAGESRSGGRNACCRVRPHILSPSLRLSFCAPSRMIRTSPPCAPSARHHAAHLTPPSEHKMPVAFQDYYATLGITREATDDDVKKAFRKLAHPTIPMSRRTRRPPRRRCLFWSSSRSVPAGQHVEDSHPASRVRSAEQAEVVTPVSSAPPLVGLDPIRIFRNSGYCRCLQSHDHAGPDPGHALHDRRGCATLARQRTQLDRRED